MTTQTPIEEFNSLLSTSSVLFVVSYLRTLQGLSDSITSLGGKPLIITSEPASFLPETRKLTSYSGHAIIDTKNILVRFVKERYELEIAVSEKKGYENGMAQPGILVLRGDKGGDIIGEDRVVLEKWAIVPNTMNLGGSSDRVELEQVWDNIRAKIEGRGPVHKVYKTTGLLGLFWGKAFG